MTTLPKIWIEKLDRGDSYPTPYRAHIIGSGFDHHGEAETPELALTYAATHWMGIESDTVDFALNIEREVPQMGAKSTDK